MEVLYSWVGHSGAAALLGDVVDQQPLSIDGFLW